MTEKKLIQVVGKGCKKCEKYFEYGKIAVDELEKTDKYIIEHFTDVEKLADIDVFLTPALRIDGKVISEGRVLSVSKIKEHL